MTIMVLRKGRKGTNKKDWYGMLSDFSLMRGAPGTLLKMPVDTYGIGLTSAGQVVTA